MAGCFLDEISSVSTAPPRLNHRAGKASGKAVLSQNADLERHMRLPGSIIGG